MFHENRKKKFHRLLIWSVTLNFFLIVIIIVMLSFNNALINSFNKEFFLIKRFFNEDRQLLLNSLLNLREKSPNELTQELLQRHGVIYGRDFRFFILGELVSRYDLDIPRALNRNVEFVHIKVGSEVISIPTQCSENEFKKICKFLKREKYPVTNKGILKILLSQLKNNTVDEDLLSYFMHSEEFQFLSSILEIENYKINPAPVLRMVIEGGEELFFNITSKDNMFKCNPKNLRREALFSYIKKKSFLAVELLIILDMDFLIHEACDQDLKNILELIDLPNSVYEIFLNELVTSCREESIRATAENILMRYNYQTSKNAMKIKESLFPEFRNRNNSYIPSQPSQPFIEHIVISGESLWEISKKYKVNLSRLMQINQLSSAILYPGQKLKIPLD